MNYTSIISYELAVKLKEKGMHKLVDSKLEGWLNSEDNITYAEAFDWLMEKGICISIIHTEKSNEICWYPVVNGECPKSMSRNDWKYSADIAIERALTLI